MGKVLKEQTEHRYTAIDLSACPVLLVTENERTQFLQKLHDGLGQMIAALNMQLSTVRKNLPENAALHQSIELLKQMNKEYREICHYLLPPPPECPGVEDAFRILCNHIKNVATCPISFRNHNFTGSLPRATVLGIYRILQDLMYFTISRPGCSTVEAGMWHQDRQLHFFIRGEVQAPPETIGQPLRISLPESLFVKTGLIGGRLHVDLVKPAYSNILLVLPCPPQEA